MKKKLAEFSQFDGAPLKCVTFSYLDANRLPSELWTGLWASEPTLLFHYDPHFCIHFYFHSNLICRLRLRRSSSSTTFLISTISSFRSDFSCLFFFKLRVCLSQKISLLITQNNFLLFSNFSSLMENFFIIIYLL